LNKKLHIICFDVPLPATYGGIIDVLYKIKSLSECGASIYLHVFKYGRQEQDELKKYCTEINYYKRNTSIFKGAGFLPYIVSSRSSEQLIKNLERIQAPILFEGLHTTLVLRKKLFQDRTLLVRTHNIEHQYYKQLATNEPNIFKKLYDLIESSRLKYYEKVLKNCNHILPLSHVDTDYFLKKFGDKTTYLPPFHSNEHIHELSKKGYFALFHGNLSISDNMKAALLLIDVFKSIQYPLVIAGQSEDKRLLQRIDLYKNISFIPISDDQKLLELFHRAHVNVLYSFNSSGVKLKLINSLFQSRYVIANSKVVKGSGLDSLCIIANDRKQITNQVLKIMDQDFSEHELARRKEVLSNYNNEVNAKKLLGLL